MLACRMRLPGGGIRIRDADDDALGTRQRVTHESQMIIVKWLESSRDGQYLIPTPADR